MYPFGLLVVVLIIQLIPKISKKNLVLEKESFENHIKNHHKRILSRQYKITNPNCDGLTIQEFNPQRRNDINILSIKRGEFSYPASANFELQLGDTLTLLGSEEELTTMKLLIGDEVKSPIELDKNISVVNIEVSEVAIVGKSLRELNLYSQSNVMITTIKRQGIELLATGESRLQIGDDIQVLGKSEHVDTFIKKISRYKNALDDTQMFPFLLGLLLGVMLGTIQFPLPGGLHLELGIAGGSLIVSLLIGYYGRLGPIKMYVPQAAKNLCRELGLLLFLACIGTVSGSGNFGKTIIENGATIICFGFSITFIVLSLTFIISHFIYKENILATLGYICGVMNNVSGVGAIRMMTKSELPALSYTTIYPLSLILKIILTQVFLLYLTYYQP